MTEDLHATTQELIRDYYDKDRKRTLAILLFAVVGVTTVLVSAVWLYQSRQKLELQQQQLINVQVQIKNNGSATVNYLDCIGHIKKPVAERTQADYDVCLDQMRKQVRGE